MPVFDIQVERNHKGKEFEKLGEFEKAKIQYEENIKENFEGNFPYDRLCIIYRKENNIPDEIRVLEKAIYVFENIVYPGRGDRLPKLDKFKLRLSKVRSLI